MISYLLAFNSLAINSLYARIENYEGIPELYLLLKEGKERFRHRFHGFALADLSVAN